MSSRLASAARHIATVFALIVGAAGVAAVLWAWNLPPFESADQITEDAYVRGQVATLAPQVAGIVAEVAVQDYQRVKAGDVLVRIDDAAFQERLTQAGAQLDMQRAQLAINDQDQRSAEAGISAAEAQVKSAEAGVTSADAEFDRAASLKTRGYGTAKDVEAQTLARAQAVAALDAARASAESARQDLASVVTRRGSIDAAIANARAAVELARLDLAHAVIAAPEDGRLGEVGARLGQYVTAGTRLATLVPDRIWVVANFKETQVAGMEIGQKVAITVDALGGAGLTGRVERFSPATGSEFSLLGSSNATGNFIKIAQRLPVRIALDPGQPLADRLAPGMSVVARVETAAPPMAAAAQER